MKLRLTRELIDQIQREAQNEQQSFYTKYIEARNRYNATLALRVGQEFELDITSNGRSGTNGVPANVQVSAQGEADHRPAIVLQMWEFPSRSGGPVHEVIIGRDEPNGELRSSCNCDAGKFRRDCHAQLSGKTAYMTGLRDRFNNGIRIRNPHANFGKVRE